MVVDYKTEFITICSIGDLKQAQQILKENTNIINYKNNTNIKNLFNRPIKYDYRKIFNDDYSNNIIISPHDGKFKAFLINRTTQLKFNNNLGINLYLC